MSVLLALLALAADPCKIGGLLGNEHDRHITIVLSDPDRQDICPVDSAGPLFPWEVPPEGQRG